MIRTSIQCGEFIGTRNSATNSTFTLHINWDRFSNDLVRYFPITNSLRMIRTTWGQCFTRRFLRKLIMTSRTIRNVSVLRDIFYVIPMRMFDFRGPTPILMNNASVMHISKGNVKFNLRKARCRIRSLRRLRLYLNEVISKITPRVLLINRSQAIRRSNLRHSKGHAFSFVSRENTSVTCINVFLNCGEAINGMLRVKEAVNVSNRQRTRRASERIRILRQNRFNDHFFRLSLSFIQGISFNFVACCENGLAISASPSITRLGATNITFQLMFMFSSSHSIGLKVMIRFILFLFILLYGNQRRAYGYCSSRGYFFRKFLVYYGNAALVQGCCITCIAG